MTINPTKYASNPSSCFRGPMDRQMGQFHSLQLCCMGIPGVTKFTDQQCYIHMQTNTTKVSANLALKDVFKF